MSGSGQSNELNTCKPLRPSTHSAPHTTWQKYQLAWFLRHSMALRRKFSAICALNLVRLSPCNLLVNSSAQMPQIEPFVPSSKPGESISLGYSIWQLAHFSITLRFLNN